MYRVYIYIYTRLIDPVIVGSWSINPLPEGALTLGRRRRGLGRLPTEGRAECLGDLWLAESLVDDDGLEHHAG
jgi:hypothetical protein